MAKQTKTVANIFNFIANFSLLIFPLIYSSCLSAPSPEWGTEINLVITEELLERDGGSLDSGLGDRDSGVVDDAIDKDGGILDNRDVGSSDDIRDNIRDNIRDSGADAETPLGISEKIKILLQKMDRIELVVSATDITEPLLFNRPMSSSQTRVVINVLVPAGRDRMFEVTIFDKLNTPLFNGSSINDILSAEGEKVTIKLAPTEEALNSIESGGSVNNDGGKTDSGGEDASVTDEAPQIVEKSQTTDLEAGKPAEFYIVIRSNDTADPKVKWELIDGHPVTDAQPKLTRVTTGTYKAVVTFTAPLVNGEDELAYKVSVTNAFGTTEEELRMKVTAVDKNTGRSEFFEAPKDDEVVTTDYDEDDKLPGIQLTARVILANFSSSSEVSLTLDGVPIGKAWSKKLDGYTLRGPDGGNDDSGDSDAGGDDDIDSSDNEDIGDTAGPSDDTGLPDIGDDASEEDSNIPARDIGGRDVPEEDDAGKDDGGTEEVDDSGNANSTRGIEYQITLIQGTHQLLAQTTDELGANYNALVIFKVEGEGISGGTGNYTIDIKLPEVEYPFIYGSNVDKDLKLGNGVQFDFEVIVKGAKGNKLLVQSDGVDISAGVNITTDPQSATYTASLAEGKHFISALIVDSTGKEVAKKDQPLTIDITPPDIEFIDPLSAKINKLLDEDPKASGAQITAHIGIYNTEKKEIEFYLDDATTPFMRGTAANDRLDIQLTLPDGNLNLKAQVYDEAGNSANISSRLVVDIIEPAIPQLNVEIVNNRKGIAGLSFKVPTEDGPNGGPVSVIHVLKGKPQDPNSLMEVETLSQTEGQISQANAPVTLQIPDFVFLTTGALVVNVEDDVGNVSSAEITVNMAPKSVNLLIPNVDFGTAVVSYDFDEDGMKDVIFGAPLSGTGGELYVLKGTEALDTVVATSLRKASPPQTVGRSAGFGSAVAVTTGYSTGDYQLLVGVPNDTESKVLGFNVDATFASSPVLSKTAFSIVGSKGGFGSQIITGIDLGTEGTEDIIIPAPAEESVTGISDAGAVYIISTPTLIPVTGPLSLSQLTNAVMHGTLQSQHIGKVVLPLKNGIYNGTDYRSALVIGADSENTSGNSLVRITDITDQSLNTLLDFNANQLNVAQVLTPAESAGKGFGKIATNEDLDGDGCADLIVGDVSGDMAFFFGCKPKAFSDAPEVKTTLTDGTPDFIKGIGDLRGEGLGTLCSNIPSDASKLRLYFGDNRQAFTKPEIVDIPLPSISAPTACYGVGDINGDGYNDFVVIGDKTKGEAVILY